MVGCGTTTSYIPADVLPKFSQERDLEILNQAPQKPYKVLGVIEVKGNFKEQMLDALKSQARQIRADAVIIEKYEKEIEEGKKAKGAYAESGLLWELPQRKINKMFSSYTLSGTAIMYTE